MNQLMRYFQKNFNENSKYNEKQPYTVTNPNGTIIRKFIMIVNDVNGNLIGEGEGRSKKSAEQKAAAALYILD